MGERWFVFWVLVVWGFSVCFEGPFLFLLICRGFVVWFGVDCLFVVVSWLVWFGVS